MCFLKLCITITRFWLKLMKGGHELKAHLPNDWWKRSFQALGVMKRVQDQPGHVIID